MANLAKYCIETGRDLYVAKSRDVGSTWTFLEVLQWFWQNTPDFKATLGSRKAEFVDTPGNMTTLFERLRYNARRVEMATPGIMPRWESESRTRLFVNMDNGSTIEGEGATENFARQGRWEACLFTEIAQLDHSLQDSIMDGISDAVGCAIYETTPNGSDGAYADKVIPMIDDPRYEADMITGEFYEDKADVQDNVKQSPLLVRVHWTLFPEKLRNGYYVDESGFTAPVTSCEEGYRLWKQGFKVRSPWYDAEIVRRSRKEGLSPRAIAQELDIDFVRSGSPVFSQADTKWGLDGSRVPNKIIAVVPDMWNVDKGNATDIPDIRDMIRNVEEGVIHVFEEPDPTKPYAIFADSAECLDEQSDFQALAVMDAMDYKIVALGADRWSTHEFMKILCVMGYWYNEALMGVETNDTGMAILAMITRRTGFSSEDEYNRLVNANAFFYNRLYVEWAKNNENQTRTSRLGWKTSRSSKRRMICGLEKLISMRQISIPDRRFWLEAKNFSNLKGGRMGGKGSHDDLVMAVAGAAEIAPFALQYKPIPYVREKIDKMALFREKVLSGDPDDDKFLFDLLKVECAKHE